MTNLPANQQDVAALISKQAPAIARAIGGATPDERQQRAERFTRVALTTIRNNDGLMKCNQASLMGALMHCASFDMEPDARGLVWLVPYGKEAQFQLGYKGMIELAIRSGAVKSIYAEIVYKAEIEAGMFDYKGGTEREIIHRRDLLRPELRKGDVAAAYAVAVMKDGSKEMAVVDHAHIEKRRNSSACKSGPWGKWYDEMAKKTAIKELCRTLPQSIEKLHKAIAVDNEYEARVIRSEEPQGMNIDALNTKVMGDPSDPAMGGEKVVGPGMVHCPMNDAVQMIDDCTDCPESGACSAIKDQAA